MSHIGNWSERKIALERSRAAERARKEAETAPREVRVYLWGRHFNYLTLTPCGTNRAGLTPEATCHRCRRVEQVKPHIILHTRYAHTAWPEVMPRLRCSTCKAPPSDLAFYAEGMANPEAAYRGRLSIRPAPSDELPPQVWTEEVTDTRWRRTP